VVTGFDASRRSSLESSGWVCKIHYRIGKPHPTAGEPQLPCLSTRYSHDRQADHQNVCTRA